MSEENEKRIAKLEKELKFAKNQIANALSLYDEARWAADKALKTRGEFMSKLSHEFRTPMNALSGYSDLLMREENRELQLRYASGIKSATNRLLNLFNDLIEVSRIESGIEVSNQEEYHMSVLIGTLMDTYRNEVKEKGLIIKLSYDENMPEVLYGDFYHVRQLVANMLDNAVKYTEKGYISLDIAARKSDMHSESGRKLVQVIFRVKDTGVGIKEKDQAKLFQAFSQFNSKNPYANEGVGVGLNVAKYYSNKMHGDITFQSTYGEGSVFTGTVMQEIIDESPIGSQALYNDDTRRQIHFKANDAKVLVVDDSMVNLNVATGLLGDYEISADTAESGYEAIKLVAENKYDIIFMDHMMPEMDGIEAMKHIKEKGDWCSKVPIIALTANATDEARRMFKKEGMNDFLAKPIDICILRDVLLKWLPKDKIKFCDLSSKYMEKERVDEDEPVFNTTNLIKYGIDFNIGLMYFGGNIKAYKSTMADIVKDCGKKLELAKKYLESKDYKNYAIEAHSAKSLAATVGATDFSALAKDNEMNAKDGNAVYLKRYGSSFIEQYKIFIETADMLLKEDSIYNGEDKMQEMEEVVLSSGEKKKMVRAAIACINDFETDEAMKYIEKLLTQKDNVEMTEVLYGVKEKIEDFEYEDAVAILESLV